MSTTLKHTLASIGIFVVFGFVFMGAVANAEPEDDFGGQSFDLSGGGYGFDEIYGGSGVDEITGSTGLNEWDGGWGIGEIYGGSGIDEIAGSGGWDAWTGGSGIDMTSGGWGFDEIYGGSGFDEITGSTGWNEWGGDWDIGEIYGDSGWGDIWGVSGADEILGGSGVDMILGSSGSDDMFGGQGITDVRGVEGFDEIFGGSGVDEIYGGSGVDEIFGGSGTFEIMGDSGVNDIFGGSGISEIYGGSGVDEIHGGSGMFEIVGGNGTNEIFGGSGVSEIFGGNGVSEIFGGSGINEIYGGSGVNEIYGGSGQSGNWSFQSDRDGRWYFEPDAKSGQWYFEPDNQQFRGLNLAGMQESTYRGWPQQASAAGAARGSSVGGSYGGSRGSSGGGSYGGGSSGGSSGGGYSQPRPQPVAMAYPQPQSRPYPVPQYYPQPVPTPVPTPTPTPSYTCSLSLSRSNIYVGESVTISWSSNLPAAARGSLTGVGQVGPTGSRPLSNLRAGVHTFYLTFANNVRCQATISVTQRPVTPPVPPTPVPPQPTGKCDILASKTSIYQGERVILSWASNVGSWGTLTGFGQVPATGTRTIAPTQTAEYVFTNSAGFSCRVTVGVMAAQGGAQTAPTCSMVARQTNGGMLLQWVTWNATSAYLNGGLGTVSVPEGSRFVQNGYGTYTLTVQGNGGVGYCQAVVQQPIAPYVAPSPVEYVGGRITQVAAPVVAVQPQVIYREAAPVVQVVEQPAPVVKVVKPTVTVSGVVTMPEQEIVLEEIPYTGFEDMILPFFLIALIATGLYAGRMLARGALNIGLRA